MRVMVFGSTGMLGHMVCDVLQNKGIEIIPITRNIFNPISDPMQKLGALTKDKAPDVIVNCVGMLVRDSASSPMNAITVNSLFPHYLSMYAEAEGCYFIHVSTDCVFNGKKGVGYRITDNTDAEDVYGKTKALAESIRYGLVIRTSIIGPELKPNGTGLFHWFMSNPDRQVTGYTDVWWNGVTTLQLATIIHGLMQEARINGIVHYTGEDVTKYNLLDMMRKIWGKNVQLIKKGDVISNKCLMPSAMFQVKGQFDMLGDLYRYMRNKPIYERYMGVI